MSMAADRRGQNDVGSINFEEANISYFELADLYGQSLPDLVVVSGRVTQDHHDHSAQ
jgi:hypothetical protein